MTSAQRGADWTDQEQQTLAHVVWQLVTDQVPLVYAHDFYVAASNKLRDGHSITRSASAVRARYERIRDQTGVDERQYIRNRLNPYPVNLPEGMHEPMQEDNTALAAVALARMNQQGSSYGNMAADLSGSLPRAREQEGQGQGQAQGLGGGFSYGSLPDRTRK